MATGLARRLGLFDATMIVMGGIVGSGIFMNPYVVARQVGTPFLILAVWMIGGVIAPIGAFVCAELSTRRPQVGGQYAYIREAYHPTAAFIYGWALLLATQTGGMAAVAVSFARNSAPLCFPASVQAAPTSRTPCCGSITRLRSFREDSSTCPITSGWGSAGRPKRSRRACNDLHPPSISFVSAVRPLR